MRYSDIPKYTDKDDLSVVLGSNHNVSLKTDTRIPSSRATYMVNTTETYSICWRAW